MTSQILDAFDAYWDTDGQLSGSAWQRIWPLPGKWYGGLALDGSKSCVGQKQLDLQQLGPSSSKTVWQAKQQVSHGCLDRWGCEFCCLMSLWPISIPSPGQDTIDDWSDSPESCDHDHHHRAPLGERSLSTCWPKLSSSMMGKSLFNGAPDDLLQDEPFGGK